jgi:hypothetical protein
MEKHTSYSPKTPLLSINSTLIRENGKSDKNGGQIPFPLANKQLYLVKNNWI